MFKFSVRSHYWCYILRNMFLKDNWLQLKNFSMPTFLLASKRIHKSVCLEWWRSYDFIDLDEAQV